MAWPRETSHSPHCSLPFMARKDNSPLRIQAASPPREQLDSSLHWEQVPEVTSLLPAPTQTETVPSPGCWHSSLHLCITLLSPRACPAPLRHPDGLPPADTAALHPTPAHGHCPVSPVLWDIALPVVSWPLGKQWPKGHSYVGTRQGTRGHCGMQWRCSSGPWAVHLPTSVPAPTCSCPQHPARPSHPRCRSRWSRCRGSPQGLYCLYGSPSSQPWASPLSPLSLRR